jgi:hypothetical protein
MTFHILAASRTIAEESFPHPLQHQSLCDFAQFFALLIG